MGSGKPVVLDELPFSIDLSPDVGELEPCLTVVDLVVGFHVLGKSWGTEFTRTAQIAVGESGLGELISSFTGPPVVCGSCESACSLVEDETVTASIGLDVIAGASGVVVNVVLISGQTSLKKYLIRGFYNCSLPKEYFFDSIMFFEHNQDSLEVELKIEL